MSVTKRCSAIRPATSRPICLSSGAILFLLPRPIKLSPDGAVNGPLLDSRLGNDLGDRRSTLVFRNVKLRKMPVAFDLELLQVWDHWSNFGDG
jgi:hypothetical protein